MWPYYYDGHGNEADLGPQLRIIVTLVTGGTPFTIEICMYM